MRAKVTASQVTATKPALADWAHSVCERLKALVCTQLGLSFPPAVEAWLTHDVMVFAAPHRLARVSSTVAKK